MSERKRLAAEKAVELVQDGMKVGLGTGSTAFFAIEAIGRLVKDGYKILAVPTSVASEKQARELGIPLATLEEAGSLDITIDGADEVDANLDLVKGMGGALLREKIVAYSTRMEVIVVDDSKIVSKLGPSSRCRWRWFRSRTDGRRRSWRSWAAGPSCAAETSRSSPTTAITSTTCISSAGSRTLSNFRRGSRISREWWRPACS